MLRKLLPHMVIVLSGMYYVFFFIDRVNAPMAFINNDITKALLFILCALAITESVMLIRSERRRQRQQNMRERPPRAPAPYSRSYDRPYPAGETRRRTY
ncbi:MAG: hypothetical protein IJH38_05505 [Clostridia bacterium]|nr:hypothetical protein [Clostridia bacterium]